MQTGANAANAGGGLIDAGEYKSVGDFVCLGSTISASGQLTKEVKARMVKTVDHFPIYQTSGGVRR